MWIGTVVSQLRKNLEDCGNKGKDSSAQKRRDEALLHFLRIKVGILG